MEQTDGLTLDRYIDRVLRSVRAALINYTQR